MARIRFSALALLGLSLAAANTARAQALPVPRDHSSEDASVYRSESLQSALGTLEDWRKAWVAGNAEQVARTYMPAAELVTTTRQVIRGRPAIQQELDGILPRVGEIQMSMDDADVGGSLVYLFGRFFQQPRAGATVDAAHPESATVQTGTYVAVLKQDGRRWLIRSQVFTLDKPAAETSADAGTQPAPAASAPATQQ